MEEEDDGVEKNGNKSPESICLQWRVDIVSRHKEEGFENAVTDAPYHHPVKPDEYHRTIGVVDDEL